MEAFIVMYNVGDVVKLTREAYNRLDWWGYRDEIFIISTVYDEYKRKEYGCTSVETNYPCFLLEQWLELIENLPVNIEEFL